ncbi:MAG: ATP-binding protein [Gallionellaceae bacterium]
MSHITNQELVETDISAIKDQLQATLDALPDLLFEVGIDGRIYSYHSPRTDLLAAPPEVFLGKRFSDVLPPDVSEVCASAILEANEKGYSVGKEYELQLEHGKFWFEASVSRKLAKQGQELRFIFLARDITERKKLERQLQEQRDEMEELQKLHVAAQTAAAIAHELNQPLHAIASYSGAARMLLQAEKPDLDKIRNAVEASERQAHRAGKSIRELLDFLSMKEFSTEPFDLNQEILDVLTVARAEHELQFQANLELEPGLPNVLASHAQVRKVLFNLLCNGIEAMLEAGVPQPAISVTVRTIKDSNVAQVTIRDNGPGFREEDIERLFKPFFTTKARGIGLGLVISRSLIEANGGQLWVDPQEKPGATFHFTLPFAP